MQFIKVKSSTEKKQSKVNDVVYFKEEKNRKDKTRKMDIYYNSNRWCGPARNYNKHINGIKIHFLKTYILNV